MKRLFKVLTLLFVAALLAVAPAAAFAEGAPDNGKPVSGLLPVAGALGLGAVAVGFATNYVGSGAQVVWTNDTSTDVASGGLVLLTNRIGVALVAIAVDASGSVAVEEEYYVDKTTGEEWTIGQRLYLVASTLKLTTNAGSNQSAGFATKAAGSSDTKGYCKLNA